MTLADIARTGLRIRMTLRRASSPLESDTLEQAARAVVQIAKLRAWA